MTKDKIKSAIINGKTSLGIEFGSTRIKAVLINEEFEVIANGSFNWENRLENKLWTYHLDDAIKGLQESYASLALDVKEKYKTELKTIGCIGISGMMHGYIALDKNDKLLAPFLTWRNTNTKQAAEKLTKLFNFNIPLRWSISHLYQSILDKKDHVRNISYLTTLAGYIHYQLTGMKVTGIGEASGMLPIDPETLNYDQNMVDAFDKILEKQKLSYRLKDILPKVLLAGANAGKLTEKGALLLDPSGKLQAGIPMVAPEGDAGTGMTATNSVASRTGNVSAGTSIFSMVVLEKNLSKIYKDIDIVTTPTGKPVAMVHCNNGTSEFDKWFNLFKDFYETMGQESDDSKIYEAMYNSSLKGDLDCSDIIYFNYLSGEPVSNLIDGRPLLVRKAESKFTFANFMRSQLYSIISALSLGNQILKKENVVIDRLTGHGGMFKAKGVAQRYLSSAMNVPVSVTKTAGEGGPYGMALLASYYLLKDNKQTLEDFLDKKVFANAKSTTVMASEEEVKAYASYLKKYKKLLNAEKEAVKAF